MKKIFVLGLGWLCCASAFGAINVESLLNRISLQFQAEQWVTTKTALVNVNVNAAVAGLGIEKLQNEIIQTLTRLSDKGAWHIVSYNRSLDQSGLESIQIVAQARLPQTELANLRERAKAISKPGETYSIDSVLFTPSVDELHTAQVALRNNIYLQAKAELDNLNKLYPDQKYYVHQINFMTAPPIQPMAMEANALMARMPQRPQSQPMSIGNKVQLQATAILASTPDVLQKLSHS